MIVPSPGDGDRQLHFDSLRKSEDFSLISNRFQQIPSRSASLCLESWSGTIEEDIIEQGYEIKGLGILRGIVTWCPVREHLMLFDPRDEVTAPDQTHHVLHRNPNYCISSFNITSRVTFQNALQEAFKLITKGKYL